MRHTISAFIEDRLPEDCVLSLLILCCQAITRHSLHNEWVVEMSCLLVLWGGKVLLVRLFFRGEGGRQEHMDGYIVCLLSFKLLNRETV